MNGRQDDRSIFPRSKLSFTETSFRRSQSSIESLPDIELGHIFDYLHWRDKLSLLRAIPDVSRVVNSPLGWRSFQAGKKQSAVIQLQELACVFEYGHFFQHCTLWLGKPCRNSWECTCHFDSLDCAYPVLEALAKNCAILKSLRLYHPSHVVSPDTNDTDIFKQYQRSFERLILHAVQKSHFRLELCGLQYSNDHVRPISLRFLDYHISNPQVLQLVRVLDITRITDSRLQQSSSNLTCLKFMVSLSTLKVPVQCITMTTIQCLVQNQLVDLYLLNDDSTSDHDFIEHEHLHWDHLLLPSKCALNVHYIFKQRTITLNGLATNPYVKSVCLDSLCMPITDDFVMAVADHYCSSLQLFAIVHSRWKPQLCLSDLSQFGSKCTRLTHFLSSVTLPTSLLVSLVHSASHLKHVLVVSCNGEDVVSSLAGYLGQEWRPHASPGTFHVGICELAFLIDDCILRGHNYCY